MDVMTLNHLLQQISRELAYPLSLSPPASDLHDLPGPLVAFFSVMDGVDLPFLRIAPVAKVRAERQGESYGPEWVWFGQDNYFSYCLCRTTPIDGLSLDLWDHESRTEMEPAYETVTELLAAAYQDWVEDDSKLVQLCVTEIPAGLSLAKVVQQIKSVSGMSSSELLKVLKSLPFSLESVPSAAAIRVVRALHGIGVGVHVQSA